jgi:hypothetical protein
MNGLAPDQNSFASRLRGIARALRWSVGVMVLSFVVAWVGATQHSVPIVRGAVIVGAIGFMSATLCFVWLAFQALSRRGSKRP